jgi:glutamate formiminotransferase/formiminotetrahydrofolate cyclodeaminase
VVQNCKFCYILNNKVLLICQAHRIALNLREQGRGAKGGPGRLKSVQGIGWWLSERNIAQISLNLTDMDQTPMHVAYEEVSNFRK